MGVRTASLAGAVGVFALDPFGDRVQGSGNRV